jgi:hypothetical protein
MLAVAASAARATPLVPGGTVSGAGTVLPTYTGTVFAAVPFSQSDFSFQSQTGMNVGFVSSAVVQAAGGLDFIYQVNVSLGHITDVPVERLEHGTIFCSADASAGSRADDDPVMDGNFWRLCGFHSLPLARWHGGKGARKRTCRGF